MTQLIPMIDTESLSQAGIGYPNTIHAWRWLYRHRQERGFTKAFRRIGRRILVDVPTYLKTVREQAPS